MSFDVQHVVDGTEHARAQVRFGRNQFLRTMGFALFALAARMVMPKEVHAAHGAPPSPCFGYGSCHACYGTTCVEYYGCNYPYWLGCPGNGQCWISQDSTGTYKCCDWWSTQSNAPCICRKRI